MWFKLFLLLFLLPLHSYSMPKNYEIWFLSIDRNEDLSASLRTKIKNSSYIAASCVKVGDKCFDPQLGLYEPTDEGEKIIEHKELVKENDFKQMKSATSLDRDMIDCSEDNKFDIFCGKAKKVDYKSVNLELWIDVSSSMRQVDGDIKCQRENFTRLVEAKCELNQKLSIDVFNESKKSMSTFNSLCGNVGLNNTKSLLQSLKNIKTKNVIIITDIFEASSDVTNFVAQNKGGKIRGLKEPLYAKDLQSLVSEVTSLCR